MKNHILFVGSRFMFILSFFCWARCAVSHQQLIEHDKRNEWRKKQFWFDVDSSSPIIIIIRTDSVWDRQLARMHLACVYGWARQHTRVINIQILLLLQTLFAIQSNPARATTPQLQIRTRIECESRDLCCAVKFKSKWWSSTECKVYYNFYGINVNGEKMVYV